MRTTIGRPRLSGHLVGAETSQEETFASVRRKADMGHHYGAFLRGELPFPKPARN
jgi:hypothetical protein